MYTTDDVRKEKPFTVKVEIKPHCVVACERKNEITKIANFIFFEMATVNFKSKIPEDRATWIVRTDIV